MTFYDKKKLFLKVCLVTSIIIFGAFLPLFLIDNLNKGKSIQNAIMVYLAMSFFNTAFYSFIVTFIIILIKSLKAKRKRKKQCLKESESGKWVKDIIMTSPTDNYSDNDNTVKPRNTHLVRPEKNKDLLKVCLAVFIPVFAINVFAILIRGINEGEPVEASILIYITCSVCISLFISFIVLMIKRWKATKDKRTKLILKVCIAVSIPVFGINVVATLIGTINNGYSVGNSILIYIISSVCTSGLFIFIVLEIIRRVKRFKLRGDYESARAGFFLGFDEEYYKITLIRYLKCLGIPEDQAVSELVEKTFIGNRYEKSEMLKEYIPLNFRKMNFVKRHQILNEAIESKIKIEETKLYKEYDSKDEVSDLGRLVKLADMTEEEFLTEYEL